MLDITTARALLARSRPTRNPDGYPEEVRAEVVDLAARLLREGRQVSGIARELGLHRSTVASWLEARGPSPSSFIPVVVAEDTRIDDEHSDAPDAGEQAVSSGEPRATRETSGSPGAPARLTLVSPGGYRLEGLDLEGAILVLSRLS